MAVVLAQGKNVNTELLRSGLAEVYCGRVPKSIYIAAFREVEQEAKQKMIGIWSLRNGYVSPCLWRKMKGRTVTR
ncbi:MAG: hypothetical protein C4530_10080 [Desulfobacteraceae bacterium]|nr:MAG: hypothetical protein C4530_10080 [Desulfobacteraceae bacterium]